MHKKLILEAFGKAMGDDREIGISSPSKSKAAQVLSDFIEEEFKFQFGERRLRDYFNAALQGEEIELKQKAVRNGLAKYLGYEDYRDFLIRNSDTKKDPQNLKPVDSRDKGKAYFVAQFLKRNRTTLLIIVGCGIAFLILNSINKEKWMVWEKNHFVETDFDPHQMEKGQILLFNENQIAHFRKIQPNCETKFFDSEGNPQLWYGKNQKGELEYFTDLGKHPETGKTLKPITRYMIDKYICR